MKINSSYLAERERWCVHKQRIHDQNICEEEKTCDLSDLVIVALLEICITAGVITVEIYYKVELIIIVRAG